MLSVGYCIAGDLLDWTHVAVKVKLWGYRLELRKRLGAKEYRRTWLFSSTSFFSCLVENASEKVNCCLLFLSSCVVDLLLEVDENGDDEKDEDAASLVQNQPVGRHSFITAKGIFTCWSNLSKLSLRWRCEFSSFLPQLCSQFFYKGISFSASIFFATFWLGQRKDGLLLVAFLFFFPLRYLLRDILFDSWTQEKHVEIEWLWFACCGVANVKKVSCCFEPCCWVTLMTNMMGKLSLCCRVERKGRTSAKEWWEESGPRSWARFFASAAIMRNFLCFVLQRQRVWTGSWATPAPTSSDIFRRWRKIATLSFLELLYCVFWRK